MKQIITFLLRKRFFKDGLKILKKKKGFSLLEVLIAVAIIGIISAIAVPQFNAQRENAAKVAGMTSISNIQKALQNCLVLKSVAECKTLGSIGISCPDCHSENASPNKFCAHIEKDSGGKKFTACASFEGSDIKRRTVGGDLLKDEKVCFDQTSNGTVWGAVTIFPQLKYCSGNTDCGTDGVVTSSGAKKYTCKKVGTSSTGKCNGSAVCG